MDAIPDRHFYETMRWLGLVAMDPPDGLHGARRGRLMARHTRLVRQFDTIGGIELAELAGHRIAVRGGVSLLRALVRTWPREREVRIMYLLRPQPLSDTLWLMIYGLMTKGGPIRLPELITFCARLSGPAAIADAEAFRLYSGWERATYGARATRG